MGVGSHKILLPVHSFKFDEFVTCCVSQYKCIKTKRYAGFESKALRPRPACKWEMAGKRQVRYCQKSQSCV